MQEKKYNNIIDYTLEHEQSDDCLAVARAIFNNMGVSLPNGDIKTVYKIIKTNNYMGWRSCIMQEAQQSADKGVPAIGISENKIIVLRATDHSDPIKELSTVMTLSENTSAYAVEGLEYYSYDNRSSVDNNPYVDIPQTGNIGTIISYMGYHKITATDSNQYKLKEHSRSHGRYSCAQPEYYAQIDGRIVIATKRNIGDQLPLTIGDYVQVRFKTDTGYVKNYDCIIGDFKGNDAPNIWGHYDGAGVVEVVYHDYNPPSCYNENKNNPWGRGRVIRVTKVGNYGNYT